MSAAASTILDQHVTLQYRCIDRLMVHAYIPLIQKPGGIVRFLQREGPVASPALLQARSDTFVEQLKAYAAAHGVPWIQLARKVRKEEQLRPSFEAAISEGRSGLIAVGVAQERMNGLRARKVASRPGRALFEWSRASVYVNHYYLYLLDPEWGPSFICIAGYAPWGIRIHLNGHEWLKRALARQGVRVVPLANGIRECSDPALAQRLGLALGPAEVRTFFARWMAQLPQPLRERDRADGYLYHLSMLQVEIADTAVLDRPLRARRCFEALLTEQLVLGRPDEVSLLFDRRIIRRGPRPTPGRFATVVIAPHTLPVLRLHYRKAVLKQYLKEGRALRTEVTFNDPRDVGIGRRLENLPALRRKAEEIADRLLALERETEAARMDGPELSELVLPQRRGEHRVPGLRFGDPRVMALLGAVVAAFGRLPLGFSNAELRRIVAALLSLTPEEYPASRMTYDLGRLMGHGLLERIAGSHRYRVSAYGLRVAAFCTKLHDRLLDPAIARSLGGPPAARGDPWSQLDAAMETLIERAHIAA